MSEQETLHAGALRERVALQAPSVTVDAFGDPVIAWSDVATVWARVRAAGGATGVVADRRTAVEDYEVTLRWRPDVGVRTRMVWRGRILEVVQLTPDERRTALVAHCRDTAPP